MNRLIVIGITGSYGKTSTKEFLYQILSTKYKVLRTEGSINTEIGVAKTILEKLDNSHDIFIVEMGAYKKGEIAAICRIVKPHIGIITGINQQHISLFGSIENTIKAKYELISNLRKKGKAFFNINNDLVKKMRDLAKEERPDLNIYSYQSQLNSDTNITFTATNIKVSPNKLSFKLNYHKQSSSCETKLAGAQNIENILAAAGAAFELDLTASQIQQAIKSLGAPDKTMKIAGKKNKLILVDDTFNANPDGVLAALDYLKISEGLKIIVLTPLIELGETADKIHQEIGSKAVRIADLLLLTNNNYYRSLSKGANHDSSGVNKVKIVSNKRVVEIINNNADKKGMVIFEGKEAGKVLQQLTIDNLQ